MKKMIRQAGPLSVSYIVLLIFLGTFIACQSDKSASTRKKSKKIEIPPLKFNEDSAYYFIEKQVSFGPRVPNTPEHNKCADWLFSYLNRLADKTIIQKGDVLAYDGKVLKMMRGIYLIMLQILVKLIIIHC